ncbi:50S ribosomal protein L18 [Candidatus Woesearchaeota archaeon]|nr:50S ribosomal protein L18 [Candidatus Woesearchaeota archaeon]
MSSRIKKGIPYRRKRAGKTDFRKRLDLLKSGLCRLVVRKSNKNIYAQLIKYSPEGDVVVNSANSTELKNFGWTLSTSNISAAYLVGVLIASKTKVKSAILDLGLLTPVSGSKIFAVIKGCIDAGLKIPHKKKVLPSEERIMGKHIQEYANKLSEESPEKFKKLFSSHVKNNIAFEKYQDYVNKTKQKILKENGKKKKQK